MDNFDLNINNYSVSELEELLTLGKQYNPQDIRYKKDNICIKIVNDETISFDMKSKLENFFEKASLVLRTIKNKNDNSNSENNLASLSSNDYEKSFENFIAFHIIIKCRMIKQISIFQCNNRIWSFNSLSE